MKVLSESTVNKEDYNRLFDWHQHKHNDFSDSDVSRNVFHSLVRRGRSAVVCGRCVYCLHNAVVVFMGPERLRAAQNDSERFSQRARARENFLEARFFLSVLINGIPARASLPRTDKSITFLCCPLAGQSMPFTNTHTHTNNTGFPARDPLRSWSPKNYNSVITFCPLWNTISCLAQCSYLLWTIHTVKNI